MEESKPESGKEGTGTMTKSNKNCVNRERIRKNALLRSLKEVDGVKGIAIDPVMAGFFYALFVESCSCLFRFFPRDM